MSIVTVTLNPAVDRTVWLPSLALGEVNRASKSISHAGGKGVNVACFLADAGVPVTVSGVLGQDNAEIFERLFSAKGLDDRFLRLPGETRVGIKLLDAQTGKTTDINLPGLPVSKSACEDLALLLDDLSCDLAWLVLSGSLPPGVDVSAYRYMIERAQAHGVRVALDSSGQPLRQALPARPSLIKPNVDELRELTGRSLSCCDDIVIAGRKILAKGVETVVVSCGSEGAVFLEAGRALRVDPLSLTVQSTVGAGDGMLAGVLYGKQQGGDLAACARWGTAFAACALTRIGAGLPAISDVKAFHDAVTIYDL